jgi:hypothetical protein
MVPRVRMDDLWLIGTKELEEKQDEATLLAIRDQERAGLDIITDGEQRRESYSKPLCNGARGRRHRKPRLDAESQRQAYSGPARDRQDPPEISRAAARLAVPAGKYEKACEDYRARTVHDVQTGAK